MSLSEKLHSTIEKFNLLHQPTQRMTEFLRKHPTLYKCALLANHIFRAVAMGAFMTVLPFSLPINFAVCFLASLFYRLTVEINCAYKFALPALAGAITFRVAQSALVQLISGVAFASLALFSTSILLLIPLATYVVYIVLTVDYDVNDRCRDEVVISHV